MRLIRWGFDWFIEVDAFESLLLINANKIWYSASNQAEQWSKLSKFPILQNLDRFDFLREWFTL